MIIEKTQFPGLIPYSGLDFYSQDDVWDMWDLPADRFLLVGTDRVWLNNKLVGAVPGKGKCLVGLMVFWAEFFKEAINNFIAIDDLSFVRKHRAFFEKFGGKLEGRILLVKKTPPMPIRWIVGHLASGGTSVTPIEADRGEALFHEDAVILLEKWIEENDIKNKETGEPIKARSLKGKMDRLSFCLFSKALSLAAERGLSLYCCTLNFGWLNGGPVLVGDFFTPNSSCLALSEDNGNHPDDLVKIWLANHKWPKGARVPKIPVAILQEASAKYEEILRRIKN